MLAHLQGTPPLLIPFACSASQPAGACAGHDYLFNVVYLSAQVYNSVASMLANLASVFPLPAHYVNISSEEAYPDL